MNCHNAFKNNSARGGGYIGVIYTVIISHTFCNFTLYILLCILNQGLECYPLLNSQSIAIWFPQKAKMQRAIEWVMYSLSCWQKLPTVSGKVLDWYSTTKHTSKFNYFLIIAKQDKPKIDNLFEVTECLLHELSLIIEIYKYSSRHLVLHVDWINVNYTQWSCCSVLIIHWNSISTL